MKKYAEVLLLPLFKAPNTIFWNTVKQEEKNKSKIR